jgi:YVTN family beta-propeller protein
MNRDRIVALGAVLFLGACGSSERSGSDPGAQPSAASASAASYRVFVTNEQSGDLTVIDGATHAVLATVPLGKRPRGIQVSPDGTQLFVALSGSPIAGPGVDEDSLPPADKSADGIGILDIASLKVLRVIRGVSDPEQLVIAHDGKRIYVASEDTGTAVVIDVASGDTVTTLQVGGEPEGIGISPDGRSVYVASEANHSIAVIDTTRNEVVRQFEVGQRPRSIAFKSDGSRAYVSGENDGTVAVVDSRLHGVLDTIRLEGDTIRPMEVDVAPGDKRFYVTTGRGQTLVEIDASNNKPLRSVVVGMRPWGLAISPDGKRLYTANGPSNDVSVVDAETFKVIATVPAGERPWGVVAARSSP